ncbi:MAG: hypothetical protein WC419_05925 [Candidatus Omnitrophota bacterium]|jgi:hypothetical protein
MHNKNILIGLVLLTVSVVSIVVAVSFFQALKKAELEFNQKKAVLVKDNLDLKDRLNSIQDLVTQKTEAVVEMEDQKRTLEQELSILKQEHEALIASSSKEIDLLKKRSLTLRKRISALENSSIVQALKDALDKENNENIRMVLDDSLRKIELIKEGKAVNLEPIVVKDDNAPQSALSDQENAQKKGEVLSLDKKSSLVVINLGRKEGVKEGDRLRIFKDADQIAGGEVISVRYRISAAVIDDIRYKSTIDDIKEGYEATLTVK